jgi:hypothetical protein
MWAKLIKGDVKAQFTHASASMLFGNLQRQYHKDPSTLTQHVQQAREFFTKYEKAMAADIRKLFG